MGTFPGPGRGSGMLTPQRSAIGNGAWKVQQVLVVSQPRRFRGFLLGTWLDTRGDWSVFGSMCGGGEPFPLAGSL